MVDLRTIISTHQQKHKNKQSEEVRPDTAPLVPTASEIPDLFFDEILVKYKLGRVDIMVLMYLYRNVWCRQNFYSTYGYSEVLSYTEISKRLDASMDEVYQALRRLESHGFIETIRSGQYFVRKYFTEENDRLYGQDYDDF